MLSGWWLGEADDRPDEPYIQAHRWETILQQAGFSEVATLMDQEPPYQLDNIIVARADDNNTTQPQALNLLVKDAAQLTDASRALMSEFCLAGYHVSLCSLQELPRRPVDVVSLLDIDGPRTFFQDMDDEDFGGLIRFIEHTRQQKILWLTGPAQIAAKNPHTAMVLGFARTLRLELGTSFATMELDNGAEPPSTWASSVVQVFEGYRNQVKQHLVDHEYALVNGTVQVPRYITSRADRVVSVPVDHVLRKIHLAKPGILGSLQWQGESRVSQLKDGELEIAVRASSVAREVRRWLGCRYRLNHVHHN